jgi:hypothetical protein
MLEISVLSCLCAFSKERLVSKEFIPQIYLITGASKATIDKLIKLGLLYENTDYYEIPLLNDYIEKFAYIWRAIREDE